MRLSSLAVRLDPVSRVLSPTFAKHATLTRPPTPGLVRSFQGRGKANGNAKNEVKPETKESTAFVGEKDRISWGNESNEKVGYFERESDLLLGPHCLNFLS
jgi:hypothetical protein